jgi:hypothetical protein
MIHKRTKRGKRWKIGNMKQEKERHEGTENGRRQENALSQVLLHFHGS